MTEEGDTFVSTVEGSNGTWPGLPRSWSYSSLHEAASCPRQWMLGRSTYSELWDEWGYPHRPSLPAMLGDVVHGALEVVLRALHDAGCTSIVDPLVVTVLRGLGGYTQLVEQGVARELDRLSHNPRASSRLDALRVALGQRVPEMRQRVQAMVARTRFYDATPFEGLPSTGPASGSSALGPGFHPEVELRAPELKLAGRVDLITLSEDGCAITDYKTGAVDESHADQLKLYALLWSRDQLHNPTSIPVCRLTISYPGNDVDLPSPSADALASLSDSTVERMGELEQALSERPPLALPETNLCRMCDVRHLCDEYWEARSTGEITDEGEWIDFEGTVVGQNGVRSWTVTASDSSSDLLLRSSSEIVPFTVGAPVRLLDLHREPAGESALPIAALTSNSEVFRCKEL